MPTDQQISLTVRTIIGADGNVDRPRKAATILAFLASEGLTVEQAVDAYNRDEQRRGVNPTLTVAAAREYLSAGVPANQPPLRPGEVTPVTPTPVTPISVTPPPTAQGGAALPLVLAVAAALLLGG